MKPYCEHGHFFLAIECHEPLCLAILSRQATFHHRVSHSGIILGLTSLAGTGVGPKVAGGIILLIAAGWVALALTDFITILQVQKYHYWQE